MSLENARIVVIGGSSGIGLQTAKMAVERGANVVICGRTSERLVSAAAELGRNVETHILDATQQEAVAAFFAAIGQFDHLTILVPASPDKAASAKLAPFLEMDSAAFERIFRNRFWTSYWAARHGAPHIREHGSIVLMSSQWPRKFMLTHSASCVASGAIEAMATALAVELAPVRVNVVAPGFILTPGTERVPPKRRVLWDKIVQSQPVRRLGRSEEIANGLLFLMENEYMTGARLDIDGGFRLN